ncbi:hypothetical protein TNIN_170881 [Trichonephila inaurata madagascariensis]|uniref:Uncharacterized protein n=1 Tax=Trichonephila inaurata madagascariensis TaxID=2747483 RepID=A0A8X6XWY3_9ARAC|nr:hypothetical protein TNIN_170881 [Trichonephila inaurata madagascariensis]
MIAQCVEQLGGILACINDDGSDFLFTRDESEILVLSVGKVTVAFGGIPRLTATIPGWQPAYFCFELLSHRKKSPLPRLPRFLSWAVGVGERCGDCRAVRLDGALFFLRCLGRRNHGALVPTPASAFEKEKVQWGTFEH